MESELEQPAPDVEPALSTYHVTIRRLAPASGSKVHILPVAFAARVKLIEE